MTGGADTKWGAERIKDGHPAPFPLHYIEVGNEDQFDRSHSYDGRYAQFYHAIKQRYPNLQIIATAPVKGVMPDVLDEHFYICSAQEGPSRAKHTTTTMPIAKVLRFLSASGPRAKATPRRTSKLLLPTQRGSRGSSATAISSSWKATRRSSST